MGYFGHVFEFAISQSPREGVQIWLISDCLWQNPLVIQIHVTLI